MGVALANLRWRPMAVTHLACVQGCLDYLDVPVTTGWLFGCTGHAFLMHLDERVRAQGPTSWDWTGDWMRLGENVGYRTTTMVARSSEADFAAKRQDAWRFVKTALNEERPCYGWDVDYPEFYAIYGYEEPDQVHVSGPMENDIGRRSWESVGSRTGALIVSRVERGESVDDREAARAGIRYALDFAEGRDASPNHASGLRAYDWWIRALNDGTADATGSGYNAMVWRECRGFAQRFLREAVERFDGALKDPIGAAIAQYDEVAGALAMVEALLPFPANDERPPNEEVRVMAVEFLEAAKEHEAAGLAALARIAERL